MQGDVQRSLDRTIPKGGGTKYINIINLGY
jgi:hypothetical protein